MVGWNWGVPDWRDAAAYEVQRSPRQWRWEFLRRRQDYREDWLMHYEPGRREALAIFGNMPLPEGVTTWEEHFSGYAYRRDAIETIEKYGISLLLDPSRACSEFELLQASYRNYPYLLHFASRRRFQEMKDASHAIVVFDLNKPIGEQLRKAKATLKRAQVELLDRAPDWRRHEDKWPLYLRAIDARAAGEALESIGVHVLGRTEDAAQHARNTLEQATELSFKLAP
jgi:hypothetical protein